MPVLYHIDDTGIVTLTLNRPELHNPLSATLLESFHAALDRLENDPNARIMILAAAGVSFLTGHDNEWLEQLAHSGENAHRQAIDSIAHLLKRLDNLPLPVIARVQGAAFGLGGGLVACCDYVVASTDALFGFSETRLGWIPAEIAPYIMRAIGARSARRYFMTGERFNASRAKRIGLVDKVVEHDELDFAIQSMCRLLRNNSPAAMGAIKQLVNDIDGKPLDDALDQLTRQRSLETRLSHEGCEGLQAFVTRQNPSWFHQVS